MTLVTSSAIDAMLKNTFKSMYKAEDYFTITKDAFGMSSEPVYPGPVPYELNPGAKVLVIGEAPGKEEVKLNRPFVGRSGQLLNKLLEIAGLKRTDCNVVNVCQFQPPKNDIDKFFTKGEPNKHVQEGKQALLDLIAETQPDAILALGNTALWALTGHRQISSRRGSLYYYELPGDSFDLSGDAVTLAAPLRIPIIPTLHPAAILRDPSSANLAARDVAKFGRIAKGEIPVAPTRRLVVNPTVEDLQELYQACVSAQMIGVDIETGNGLRCIGFAPRADYAVCIPYGIDTHESIQQLLALNIPKVFHHSPYDVPYLTQKCGFTILGDLHDTLAMAQALNPELPRDLGTLVSLYTDEPYFKDLGTLWHKTKDYDTFYRYNCLDTATTREIADVLLKKLDEHGLRGVYEMTRAVLPHALAMSARGVKYDKCEAEQRRGQLDRTIARNQSILDGRAGRPVNVYSGPDARWFLYDHLALPKRYDGDSETPTTGQSKLLGLYPLLTDRRARQSLRAFLAVRHDRKLRSSYFDVAASADGRMRTSFNPAGTETGRWSAGRYLITEGTNLQTVPPSWKSCFVADDGCILWNADYSQIEARIVSYLAQDERSIEIFEDPEGDIHRENAAVIFNKKPHEVTSRERDIGKTVHALNYGIGPDTLTESVNKRALETGVWIDAEFAKYIRTTYLERFTKVVKWQKDTWSTIKKTHELTNPFGRRRIFLGATKFEGAEHTKREALAFVPQSTVPDMLNQAIVKLRVSPSVDGFECLLNVHDAIFGQAPEASMSTWLPAIKAAMEIPLTIHGRTFTVPVDIKIGKRWSTMKKVTL